MVHLTQKAAKKIQQLIAEEDRPISTQLRVKVKKGGCSGLSYELDFTEEIQGQDKAFEEHGAKIVVDPESYLYLLGLTLDYEGGLNGQGFVFSNPNASKTCSCGSSFSVK